MINISHEDVDFIMQEIQKIKLQKISKIFDFLTNFQDDERFQVSPGHSSFLDILHSCGRVVR